MYDYNSSAGTQAKIASILEVKSRRVVGCAGGVAAGGFCRGVEVDILFDEDRFADNGLFLFASVLERFLGLYCTINSFSKLVARSKQKQGVLRQWPPRSRENLALIERLSCEPYRFDFFQAVRILECAVHGTNGDEVRANGGSPVGYDAAPSSEAVRFRASPTLGFPSCAVMDVRQSPQSNGNGSASTEASEATRHAGGVDMVVSFMGLTGPSGVLPLHYTRLLIERIREKDYSLREFFDLFNHRLISLFYRAWEKYRFPAGYVRSHEEEANARDGKPRLDLFTSSLFSLVGMGTKGIRGRLSVADEAFLFYGGYFADGHRSATALERMIGDYFNLPAKTDQFKGQWLNLEARGSLAPG